MNRIKQSHMQIESENTNIGDRGREAGGGERRLLQCIYSGRDKTVRKSKRIRGRREYEGKRKVKAQVYACECLKVPMDSDQAPDVRREPSVGESENYLLQLT